jgi:midasin
MLICLLPSRILLDEINLASSETLEALSTILESSTSSVVLTERGDLEPVERHPDFRLFACMNPATDVGKKDLPPGLRARFTEIYAPPPDDDEDALRGIVKQYLGDAVAGDRSAIADVAEFYSGIKALARHKEIVDGTNTPPHFSMRTLARALTFAVEVSPSFGIRRGLWEGLLMTFTMSLDSASYDIARRLCADKVLRGMRNVGARFGGQPAVPDVSRPDDFVLFGDYWLEKGPEPVVIDEKYIKTPSVANKLADLARIIMTRKLPVLIQGPTSSGKTSAVEFLAKQTGHRFVRINNHEHTDIQEYLGTYASDPVTGNLVFREGVLVTAVRNGYWLVLDELNLAPTDVLEALNRLLDDNRELVLPETGEVVRPHPHFMLFATQNPPGLYAGRKVLSRAFRNRFLEVHFEDVPQEELQEILHRRSDIAPTYARLIVEVFRELQHRRQATRVFESRQSFATLRDLFRWAGRDAISHQQLAENGYLLLAERARKEEDRLVVKEVLEKKIKAKIDENALLQVTLDDSSAYSKLGLPLPDHLETNIVWTKAMQRLFTLVAAAAANDEPILLVGETGSGKTSVCEVIASLLQRQLISVSCHQNMETADLLGSQRPVRNRGVKLTLIAKRIEDLCQTLQIPCPAGDFASVDGLLAVLTTLAQDARVEAAKPQIDDLRISVQQASALFEWSDGPLVHAMQEGSVLLLDELSLADDSVLERLNSVLEPAKVLVLAEKGGASDLDCTIVGHAGFQVIATMNPGGDFGKKELSPALRNRFTEIWVPAVTDRDDLEQIIDRSFRSERLKSCTPRILDFLQWFSDHVVDQSQTGIGLRDILVSDRRSCEFQWYLSLLVCYQAWVAFSNACADGLQMSTADVFVSAVKSLRMPVLI